MVINTHNGVFHADEVFAAAWLRLLHGEDTVILRSRRPEDIEAADIVIDVGGQLNPAGGRFDHHQGEVGTYSDEYDVPLSSFGLVLKYLPEGAGKILGLDPKVVANYIYGRLAVHVDRQDNGDHADAFTVSDYISSFNSEEIYSTNQNRQFSIAVRVASDLLVRLIASLKRQIEDEEIVLDAVAEADGNVIEFSRFVPGWIQIMADNALLSDKYRIIWPDGQSWRVRACPAIAGDNASIRQLNVPADVQQDEDFIFVHKAGFIAGTKSRDLAIKLAKLG